MDTQAGEWSPALLPAAGVYHGDFPLPGLDCKLILDDSSLPPVQEASVGTCFLPVLRHTLARPHLTGPMRLLLSLSQSVPCYGRKGNLGPEPRIQAY